jgi:hypothetical protein
LTGGASWCTLDLTETPNEEQGCLIAMSRTIGTVPTTTASLDRTNLHKLESRAQLYVKRENMVATRLELLSIMNILATLDLTVVVA